MKALAPPPLSIHTDGGARGNPGPAASAYVITGPDGVIHESSRYLGETTNNMAEYQGIIDALEWLCGQARFHGSSLSFYSDSQLVINQIAGTYRVKEPRFLPLLSRIRQLIVAGHYETAYIAIPRGENGRADALVNRALDEARLR